jgi:hypothetical protein
MLPPVVSNWTMMFTEAVDELLFTLKAVSVHAYVPAVYVPTGMMMLHPVLCMLSR